MESKVAKNTSNCRWLRVNLCSNCAAIRPQLQQQILATIRLPSLPGLAADLQIDTELKPEMVALRRFSATSCIVYRSAIAFQLAPLLRLSALDIANYLITSLQTSRPYTAGQICLDFSVEVVSPGWINFELSDQGLATWLQHLSQFNAPSFEAEPHTTQPTPKSPLPPQLAETLFSIQYAHARCCSLLRLANRQGFIKLKDVDFTTGGWQLVEPNPIPWLNDNSEVDTGQVTLRLVHPAERRLIALLLDVSDQIGMQGQSRGIKLAKTLSHAFEQFYSSCRIWGEVKTETPKLAQARLGLVGVTQVLVRSLLQDQLGIPAPVEL